jgi:hypothetical protein
MKVFTRGFTGDNPQTELAPSAADPLSLTQRRLRVRGELPGQRFREQSPPFPEIAAIHCS